MEHHNTIPSLNAWQPRLVEGMMHRIYGVRKRSICRKLIGTVVEIGPGASANFRYYKRGIHVIAVAKKTRDMKLSQAAVLVKQGAAEALSYYFFP